MGNGVYFAETLSKEYPMDVVHVHIEGPLKL